MTALERVSSLQLAPDAWTLAQRIAQTDFVPPPLRGKPEAVLACILTGHEAGLSPMQSLAKINIIEGRPAMSAELMRALVLSAGHRLHYDTATNTKCVAVGERHDNPTQATRVEWTLDDAKRAGLEQRPNWRKYPKAMLIARATAELCRMIFPDVLAGISYTVEELTDGELVDLDRPDYVDTTPAPTKRRARKAITQHTTPPPEPEPATRGDIPDLPEPAPPIDTTSHPANVTRLTPPVHDPQEPWAGDNTPDPEPQRRLNAIQWIAIRLDELAPPTDTSKAARQQRLEAVSRMVGRPITTQNQLTPTEIREIRQRLEHGENPYANRN
jgi:hypothetical protein